MPMVGTIWGCWRRARDRARRHGRTLSMHCGYSLIMRRPGRICKGLMRGVEALRSVISKFMRVFLPRLTLLSGITLVAAVAIALQATAQAQSPEAFRWVDFHAANDQNVVAWIERSLAGENWTAIREIGGEYDAALVITTDRTT